MKSQLDATTSPDEKFTAFQKGLRQILSVSKTELANREKQWQKERATKGKPGPKPRTSTSDRVSDNEG